MDKEQLFKELFDEDEVDLGRRGTVRIRTLSRAEVFTMRKRKDWNDPAIAERIMLATALVDPVITEEDAKHWQAASSAGEIKLVIDRIGELSGMTEDADKNAYKSTGDES